MNSDTPNGSTTPDGSTDASAEEKNRTDQLSDGSQSDGTPQNDNDTASGGPADEPATEPQVSRPDPEDLPADPADDLDDDFDPAEEPSNPDLVNGHG